MKNTFLALVLAALGASAASAQSIALHGTVRGAASAGVGRIALEFWNVERWQQLEVIELEAGEKFGLTLVGVLPGQYRFRQFNDPKKWNDFLMPDSLPAGATLAFTLDVKGMDGSPARVRGLAESEQYAVLIDAQRALERLRDSLGAQKPAAVNAAEADLNRLIGQLATQYRKTMLSDVALTFYRPTPADYPNDPAAAQMTPDEFARAHALDRLNTHHERVMFHNGLMKALNRYRDHFGRTPETSRAYIDAVMTRRGASDAVNAWLFKYLLDAMIDGKDEAGLAYLLKWYTPDCSADENPLPTGVQNLIVALKTCSPGNPAPPLALPGLDGKPLALADVTAKNSLTLLMFWRSTCTHCREFEPELERLYKKYRARGVEVYAISSDKEESEWRAFLQEHPMPWLNVFIPKEKRQEMSRLYPFPSTPTLIAVDAKGRIVSRLIQRSALEGFLEEQLKKK